MLAYQRYINLDYLTFIQLIVTLNHNLHQKIVFYFTLHFWNNQPLTVFLQCWHVKDR